MEMVRKCYFDGFHFEKPCITFYPPSHCRLMGYWRHCAGWASDVATEVCDCDNLNKVMWQFQIDTMGISIRMLRGSTGGH